jgi:hypothetical protein
MKNGGVIASFVLAFALSLSIPARAQEAAKPDAGSGATLLFLVLMSVPLLIVVALTVPIMRRAKHNATHIQRSLEIGEESLRLTRECVALQKETNNLLRHIVEKQSRF